MEEYFHQFPEFKIPHPKEEDMKSQGSGSGVIVSEDGYIITNNHVVENAIENGIEVVTNDSKRFKAKLIGTDPLTDVAVIKIEEKIYLSRRLAIRKICKLANGFWQSVHRSD